PLRPVGDVSAARRLAKAAGGWFVGICALVAGRCAVVMGVGLVIVARDSLDDLGLVNASFFDAVDDLALVFQFVLDNVINFIQIIFVRLCQALGEGFQFRIAFFRLGTGVFDIARIGQNLAVHLGQRFNCFRLGQFFG